VWIAGRSAENAEKSIAAIKAAHPSSKGQVRFLELDLSDLSTIPTAVKEFTTASSRLDILINNAGVSSTPVGSTTKQGYELVWGTNVLGHHYWTRLLMPFIRRTVKNTQKNDSSMTTRIVWVSSFAAFSVHAPNPGGINWDDLAFENHPLGLLRIAPYAQSKAANILQAAEFARRFQSDTEILNISLHPGGLRTNIGRHVEGWTVWLLKVSFLIISRSLITDYLDISLS
jgi:retinol dehydrogenase-12